MYRTSTQEPRYKHSLNEREPRHVESREVSEEYSSSSEEEEESSGKYTEESDEETIESQESHSLKKRNEWSPSFEQQWSYNKLEKCEKNPYICERIHKQDKVTQKNLLSPFPSFLIPPIPRQVTGPPYYRLPNVKSPKDEQNNLKNANKCPPKKSRNYREEESLTCGVHKNHDFKERKVSKKPKTQKDQLNQSKVSSSDRIFKCMHHESPEESSRNFSKCVGEAERLSKQSTSSPKYIRRPKSSTRENTNNQQTMAKYADCTLQHEVRGKSRPKTAIGVIPCEKDTNIREAILARNIGDGKLANKKGGEVREKLVYVVEEEGKEITKLETDLFTLNEILAIKRDLLELSEFAKKLKKLKEMKKESESTKNKENTCQCKPAEELLKDVNRRIEILEARQEELERENNKSGQKGDTETESKNTNVTEVPSGRQSKTPAMIQSSAATTVPSFPKTEIFVTRPEGFSNNSDIVKELMDIKTQLQRLEKKRISKKVSDEVGLEGSTKLTTNKNHAIAVFSSRTYIFTTETFDKKKTGEKIKKEEKGKNYVTSIEENTTKNEQRKTNVASWLKNIKIGQTETDVSMFLSLERLKREENDPEKSKGNSNVKRRNCFQTSKMKAFENQEPRKNRALKSDKRKNDNSYAKLLKNESTINDINPYVGYKKCIMTPSGKLFALISESNEKVLRIPSACDIKPPPNVNPERLPSRAICRSGSSGSITSAILVKEQVRRLKTQKHADKHCKELIPRPSHSRSMQELSSNSGFCKIEKIERYTNMKNLEKTEDPLLPDPKVKKNKEDKNEFVKYLETHLMALKKNFEKRDPTTSSCTYSEFLASINLDSEKTSAIIESNTLQKNIASNEIYTYMASTKTNLKALDSHNQQEESYKESRKKKNEKKQKINEKKEKNTSELKKKSKPKKEKKCKEPTKQTKCKKKKKKKHRCNCKNSNYSNFWKSYYRGDCFKCNEKKPTSDRPKISSEENLEIYRKQSTERSKINLDNQKLTIDSFTIKNIFKNLGRYYPKISNFHLFPFPRGEFCDKKQGEYTKSKNSITKIINKSEEQEKRDDYDDEDNDDGNLTSGDSYICQSLYNVKYSDQENHHNFRKTAKPDDLKNCKCVQVYLQTQEQQRLSGLGPFKALSVESMTNESTSISEAESCKSAKSESSFSERKPHIQYVYHSTQTCEKKKDKCDKKCKKGKKRKREKCKVCVCCKCGHAHDINKKKRKKCDDECCKSVKSESNECSDSHLKHCSCDGKPQTETSPLFSFLTNFCKVKPRQSKLSKRIAEKISEVRFLKTCSQVKTNFFSKFQSHLPKSCDRKSHKEHNSCLCTLRLQDIEKKLEKLEKLEKKKSKCCNRCKKDKEKEKKKKRKEKEKKCKKKKKKCCCTDSSESKSSCHNIECLCYEVKKKKSEKKCKKKKKKNHKKHKMKCCCSESKKNDQKCSGAYYYTIDSLSPNKTPEASTYKTATTDSTVEEEDKEEKKNKKEEKFPCIPKSKDLLEQTNTRVNEKLCSLTPCLENVQKYKITKSEWANMAKIKNKKPTGFLEPEMAFLGDFSKRDKSKARKSQGYEIKETPVTFFKKITKRKKREKETNEKLKKEKKTLKSKPKNRSEK